MKYVLEPSLEHMALVKIVVVLWNQNDVRGLIANCSTLFFSPELVQWKNIEVKIIEKVSQLLLPQLLKEKLLCFIKPIGIQVLEWMKYNFENIYLKVHLPTELFWTPEGTLDRKRTAEVLVRNENVSISTRYKLACFYCLEDDIQKLWYVMPEFLKKSFLCESSSDNVVCWRYAVSLWTHSMKKKGLGNAHISYKSAFEYFVKNGNKEAAVCFLQKLMPAEREASLVDIADHVTDADLLCILLSELNEEQQKEVFKNNPCYLAWFLNWPLQSFFMEVVDSVWDILPKENYSFLLQKIIDKVACGFRDWKYEELFGEFWKKNPNAIQCLKTRKFNYGTTLQSIIFKIKDKENLRLILKDLTFTEKKLLIYSANARNYCCCLIYDDQWDVLECFIKECLPSKDERMLFKKKFQQRMKKSEFWKRLKVFENKEFLMEMENEIGHQIEYHLEANKHKWDQLYHFSDDYNKRSVGEGENSSSKRLKNLQ